MDIYDADDFNIKIQTREESKRAELENQAREMQSSSWLTRALSWLWRKLGLC